MEAIHREMAGREEGKEGRKVGWKRFLDEPSEWESGRR